MLEVEERLRYNVCFEQWLMRGRAFSLRRTCWDGVEEDMKCLVCTERMHRSRTNGNGESREQPANPGSPERMAINMVWEIVFMCVSFIVEFAS